MSRSLFDSEREVWSRTTSLLVLGFICYALPWSVFAADANNSQLRIQGSNTIGAALGPALVKGLLAQQGLSNIRSTPGAIENEQQISATTANGKTVHFDLAAHGSSTGFAALLDGTADLAAASRPIKSSEVSALASRGDMKSPAAEQIIAIDGLAIIINPQNPISALRTDQLAAIYAGEIRNWADVGGKPGPINLYARDDNSGTYDTFKELVLAANGKSLSGDAERYEDSNKLSQLVSDDPQGIGFIGLPYILKAKALAIAAGDSQPMLPSRTLIATEDYPLSRRLFIYAPPTLENSWARQLLAFAHSEEGQHVVAQNGFIAQTVQAVKVTPNPNMPEPYQQLAKQAQRLSVNFRFEQGSATLDNKAQRDLQRVLDYLQAQDKMNRKAVLVGFGDPKADPARAELLSKLRAMAVRRELARGKVSFADILGMGEQLPIAANDMDEGRIKNRRVEVWVYN